MPNRTVYISDAQLPAWKRLCEIASEYEMGVGEYILATIRSDKLPTIRDRVYDLEARVAALEARK